MTKAIGDDRPTGIGITQWYWDHSMPCVFFDDEKLVSDLFTGLGRDGGDSSSRPEPGAEPFIRAGLKTTGRLVAAWSTEG